MENGGSFIWFTDGRTSARDLCGQAFLTNYVHPISALRSVHLLTCDALLRRRWHLHAIPRIEQVETLHLVPSFWEPFIEKLQIFSEQAETCWPAWWMLVLITDMNLSRIWARKRLKMSLSIHMGLWGTNVAALNKGRFAWYYSECQMITRNMLQSSIKELDDCLCFSNGWCVNLLESYGNQLLPSSMKLTTFAQSIRQLNRLQQIKHCVCQNCSVLYCTLL